MASEKTKGTISRIPVPKTKSLQRLSQTQSIDNLSMIRPKPTNRSPAVNRRITRQSSISRLPICKSTTVKYFPSIERQLSNVSKSSRDLSTNNWNNSQINGFKSKVTPKLFKPNDSHISCQRYQRNHNQSQCQSKPLTSFKIYNKFSPYYENESLDSQTSDHQKHNSVDYDCISTISSSAEESVKSSAPKTVKHQNGIPHHCEERSRSRESMLYRTQSVPEQIQQTSDSNSINSKPNDLLDNKVIEKLKNRLLDSLNNENEDQELEDVNDADNDHLDYNMSLNVENKLLRIVVRHLKEKLSQTKTNLDQLTQQLASNKQMCEAFQKSLSAMTIRAQHLTQQLDNKQTVLDTIENQLKDKTLDYEDLSRKYQLLDNEYKKLQKLNTNLINNNIINENNSRTDSSMSNLSYGDSCHTDGSTRVKSRSTPSWLRGSTLSKAFRRRKKLNIFSNSSSDLYSTAKTESSESVTHLRDLIRQKELTITDLRLESLATTNRLEKLEDDLKSSRQETNQMKKNKDYLEKMIKMKIIE